jgi:hypothetical protein
MMVMMLLQVPDERIGPEYLGTLIPLAVFLIAFGSVWFLYRRFMGRS